MLDSATLALPLVQDHPRRSELVSEHGYPASFYVNSLRWAGFKMAEVVFQAEKRIV